LPGGRISAKQLTVHERHVMSAGFLTRLTRKREVFQSGPLALTFHRSICTDATKSRAINTTAIWQRLPKAT
jgi:hypothetical protein